MTARHKTICYPEARINQNVCKLWVAILKQDLQKCNLNDKAAFIKQWQQEIWKYNNIHKGGKMPCLVCKKSKSNNMCEYTEPVSLLI